VITYYWTEVYKVTVISSHADTSLAPAPTILVVEKDVQLRFLISDTLRNDGFKVIEAGNTDEALAFLRTPNNVALVFSDVLVPGKVEGPDFVKTLQREFPKVKIILTTGEFSRDSIPESLLVIRKPYILARVISDVRVALGLEPPGSLSR
jgi:DNA-binding NtrC family response regulator